MYVHRISAIKTLLLFYKSFCMSVCGLSVHRSVGVPVCSSCCSWSTARPLSAVCGTVTATDTPAATVGRPTTSTTADQRFHCSIRPSRRRRRPRLASRQIKSIDSGKSDARTDGMAATAFVRAALRVALCH